MSSHAQHAQIALLEIPEELRKDFTTPRLTEMEVSFASQAEREFRAALEIPVLPEHSTRQWLDRLEYPLGVTDNATFFESWQNGL